MIEIQKNYVLTLTEDHPRISLRQIADRARDVLEPEKNH